MIPVPETFTPASRRVLRALLDAEAPTSTTLLERIGEEGGVGGEFLETHPNVIGNVTDGEADAESLAVPALMREAERIAANLGTPSEVDTGHVLLAFLEATGVGSAEGFAGTLRAILEANAEPSPLPVDFTLEPEHDSGQHVDVLRILDATANRAREGLRTIEDYCRFVLDDPFLSRELKRFRHELAARLRGLPTGVLLICRETEGDVGRVITTPAEGQRGAVDDVVRAAIKRLQESLRSLEEFGKLISRSFAAAIEQLRYFSYTLEKLIGVANARDTRLQAARLYVLVSSTDCDPDFESVVRGAIVGGADVIQLREKSATDRERLRRGRQVREWINALTASGHIGEREVLFIMNDRPDLAVLCDADGVHVGQEELSVHEARRILGPDRLVGVSTHSIDQARQAVLDGADYLGVGPTFPSGTKSFTDFAGLEYVRQVAGEIALPWFAIGGIDASNVGDVTAAGATRVAISGAITRSGKASSAAGRLRGHLDRVSAGVADSGQSSSGA